ncbi:MAG: hypothetical protein Ct9H90mP24_0580 [Methanobacteriota archaeon]|nr:MAG: hypothetical protein Ct9H90mP24_0580 [Euryarchaeota archaeon]
MFILDNGEIQCWGRNNFGQLGDGTNTHSSTPVEVSMGEVPVHYLLGTGTPVQLWTMPA